MRKRGSLFFPKPLCFVTLGLFNELLGSVDGNFLYDKGFVKKERIFKIWKGIETFPATCDVFLFVPPLGVHSNKLTCEKF